MSADPQTTEDDDLNRLCDERLAAGETPVSLTMDDLRRRRAVFLEDENRRLHAALQTIADCEGSDITARELVSYAKEALANDR